MENKRLVCDVGNGRLRAWAATATLLRIFGVLANRFRLISAYLPVHIAHLDYVELVLVTYFDHSPYCLDRAIQLVL